MNEKRHGKCYNACIIQYQQTSYRIVLISHTTISISKQVLVIRGNKKSSAGIKTKRILLQVLKEIQLIVANENIFLHLIPCCHSMQLSKLENDKI
mmetsp:Transcript_10683/g.31193  ORF Transcript_10683/g.31193 Transcript_10683/m.31193 type:complete len:95 (-) Transcript_10683:33-317(-)